VWCLQDQISQTNQRNQRIKVTGIDIFSPLSQTQTPHHLRSLCKPACHSELGALIDAFKWARGMSPSVEVD
jgi:hypothetical protein